MLGGGEGGWGREEEEEGGEAGTTEVSGGGRSKGKGGWGKRGTRRRGRQRKMDSRMEMESEGGEYAREVGKKAGEEEDWIKRPPGGNLNEGNIVLVAVALAATEDEKD